MSITKPDAILPFRVNVPEANLADLRRRLAATRWPNKELVGDRSQGVQHATLQKPVRYWATEYDWQRCEARLNALPQLTTEIDDGPEDRGGLRYCINSASLRFIHRDVLAGGCFWGMQDLFRRQEGVISTRVGYTGGDVANATYRNHGSHAEALEITFDPAKISYRALLEFFFQIHDPTTMNRQGTDVGASYRSAIYYASD